jgi:hypothetical protein
MASITLGPSQNSRDLHIRYNQSLILAFMLTTLGLHSTLPPISAPSTRHTGHIIIIIVRQIIIIAMRNVSLSLSPSASCSRFPRAFASPSFTQSLPSCAPRLLALSRRVTRVAERSTIRPVIVSSSTCTTKHRTIIPPSYSVHSKAVRTSLYRDHRDHPRTANALAAKGPA